MKKSLHRVCASFGIGLGVLIGALDWSIVQNALPEIQSNLEASIGQLQWIMNSFGLFLTALLVTTGRLGDIYGRRCIFNLGLLVFALSSLGAALSSTPFWLIIARGFQGMSLAMLIPTSQALLIHAFPKNKHGKAIGLWATLGGMGLVLGPVLGGIIVSVLSWHWIFYINIPFAALSYILVKGFVVESKNKEHPPHLDIKGIIIFTLALGLFIFAIIQAPEWGWGAPIILACFAVAIILFVLFYFVEKQVDLPLIQFSFFRNHQFTTGALVMFSGCFLFCSVFFLLPLYLQNYLNKTPWISGLILISAGFPFTIISNFSGPAGDRIDKRKLISIGFLLVFISVFVFTQIESTTSLFWICVMLVFFGAGQALLWSPGTSLGISALPRSQSGVASGAITTIQETGGSLGIALVGTVFRITEKYHYQELIDVHHMNISSKTAQKVQTLLSEPTKLHQYVREQAPALQHKLISIFKSSFLFGFHFGMILSTALAFITMVIIFFLLKKKTSSI